MKPIGDNIILRRIAEKETTDSGIILAKGPNSEVARKVYADSGVVVESNTNDFVKDEIVVFHRFGSNVINDGDIEYYIVPISDIIAKIEEN